MDGDEEIGGCRTDEENSECKMVLGKSKVSPVVAVTGKNDAPAVVGISSEVKWGLSSPKVLVPLGHGPATDSQEVNSRHSDEGGNRGQDRYHKTGQAKARNKHRDLEE